MKFLDKWSRLPFFFFFFQNKFDLFINRILITTSLRMVKVHWQMSKKKRIKKQVLKKQWMISSHFYKYKYNFFWWKWTRTIINYRVIIDLCYWLFRSLTIFGTCCKLRLIVTWILLSFHRFCFLIRWSIKIWWFWF